jgi:hypothetical protein
LRELVDILRAITAARSALNTCTSPMSRNAASCRTGWKAGQGDRLHPRRQEGDPAGRDRGEQYEKFLGRKYVGTKRFGLDGGESMIPALEAVIKYGGQRGVREIVYGMAHRGRLNVLANVLAKPYRVIFHEFSGGTPTPKMSADRATSNTTSAPAPTANLTGSRCT